MKAILSVLSALVFTPVAASANGTFEDHNHLWRALNEVGVTIRVNHPQMCAGNTGGGHYQSFYNTLVICQDNAKSYTDGQQVKWSDNDLDTLRHEAHHVIQDCLDGTMGDGQLSPLYDTQEKWVEFVTQMNKDKIDWIMETYMSNGATDEVLTLELEAFTASEFVSATTIASAVKQACAGA